MLFVTPTAKSWECEPYSVGICLPLWFVSNQLKVSHMSFEVAGRLHKKFETENKTDTFRAREFVIEIDGGNYPQFIKFQCVQDRTAIVDDVNEGDQIKVHFDLRGREWQGKYFTNLNAWRVESVQPTAGVSGAADENFGEFPAASDDPGEDLSGSDDLPF